MTNSFVINFENKVISFKDAAMQFRQACEGDAVREGNGKQYPENLQLMASLRSHLIGLQSELQKIYDVTKENSEK